MFRRFAKSGFFYRLNEACMYIQEMTRKLLVLLFSLSVLNVHADVPQNLKGFLELKNPSKAEQNKFYDDVTAWAEKDPKLAKEWAYELQEDRGDKDVTASTATLGVIRAISKSGPTKTFEWIRDNLDEEKDRLDAIVCLQVVEAFKNIPMVDIAKEGNKVFELDSNENVYIAQNYFLNVPENEIDDALSYGANLPEGLYKVTVLGPVVDQLAKKDFKKASAFWDRLADGQAKDVLFSSTFQKELIQMKPIDSIEWLKIHKVKGIRLDLLEAKIFGQWFKSDKNSATDFFVERMHSSKPASALFYINELEPAGPAIVLDVLAKVRDEKTRALNLEMYSKSLLKKDPEAFEKIQKETKNPEIKNALNKALMTSDASNGPKAACFFFQNLPEKERDSLRMDFLFSCLRWHEKEPKEFMQWARTLRKKDYDSIILFLQSTSSKFVSDETTQYVVQEMALGPKRDSAIGRIAEQKANKDPEEAADWALGLDKPAEQDEALGAVMYMWGTKNPELAVNWIVIHIKEREVLNAQLLYPFIVLAKKDYQQAVTKALELSNQNLRNNTLIFLSSFLSNADLSEAHRIALSIPSLPERRRFLEIIVLAKSNSIKDIRKNAEFLVSNNIYPFNTEDGNNPFAGLLDLWAKKDRADCLAWVRNAPANNPTEVALKAGIIANLIAGDDPYLSGRISKENKQHVKESSAAHQELALSSSGLFEYIKIKTINGEFAKNIHATILLFCMVMCLPKYYFLLRNRKNLPLSMQWAIGILLTSLILSFFSGIGSLLNQHNILTTTTLLDALGMAFAIPFIAAICMVIVNQCARGSRLLVVLSCLMVVCGVLSIATSLLNKTSLVSPISLLAWGTPLAYLSLTKTARDFRKNSKKTCIPKGLFISMSLLIFVLLLSGGLDIYKTWHSNLKIASQNLWQIPLGCFLIFSPLIWGLRWGDKITLFLFLFLVLFVAFVGGCGFSLIFTESDQPMRILPLIVSSLFFTPLIFIFSKSNFAWYKTLRPAL